LERKDKGNRGGRNRLLFGEVKKKWNDLGGVFKEGKGQNFSLPSILILKRGWGERRKGKWRTNDNRGPLFLGLRGGMKKEDYGGKMGGLLFGGSKKGMVVG